MPTLLRLSLLSALALASLPASAQADRSGFWIGARLQSTGLSTDNGFDTTTEGGGGVALEAGYAFSRVAGVYLSVGGSAMQGEDGGEDYTLGSAYLGGRFNLTPSKALNPYLLVGLTGQSAAFDVAGTSADLEVSGGGLYAGVGLDYALSPALSIDGRLTVGGGQFSEISFDGESTDNFDAIDFGVAHLGLGVTFRP